MPAAGFLGMCMEYMARNPDTTSICFRFSFVRVVNEQSSFL